MHSCSFERFLVAGAATPPLAIPKVLQRRDGSNVRVDDEVLADVTDTQKLDVIITVGGFL